MGNIDIHKALLEAAQTEKDAMDFYKYGFAASVHRFLDRANANIDDIGDTPAAVAPYPALMQCIDELLDLIEHLPDLRHTGCFQRHLVGHLGSQRRMQYRPVLRKVDCLAREHRPARLIDTDFVGQLCQELQRLAANEVSGVIEQEIVILDS